MSHAKEGRSDERVMSMFGSRGWFQVQCVSSESEEQKEWLKAQARALRQTQIQKSQSQADSLHAIFKLNSFLEDSAATKQLNDLPVGQSDPSNQDETTRRVNDVFGSFNDFWDLYEREGLSRLVGIQLPGTKAPPLTKRIPLEKNDQLAVMKAVVASNRIRRRLSHHGPASAPHSSASFEVTYTT